MVIRVSEIPDDGLSIEGADRLPEPFRDHSWRLEELSLLVERDDRDVLISTIAATLAGAITYLAHMMQWAAFFGGGRSSDDEEGGSPWAMLLLAILAPFAAMLVQLAVSRAATATWSSVTAPAELPTRASPS